MIVYANGRVIGSTSEGDAEFIKVIGANQDSLSTSDETITMYLYNILKELRISNIHLQIMTDQKINDGDVVQDLI